MGRTKYTVIWMFFVFLFLILLIAIGLSKFYIARNAVVEPVKQEMEKEKEEKKVSPPKVETKEEIADIPEAEEIDISIDAESEEEMILEPEVIDLEPELPVKKKELTAIYIPLTRSLFANSDNLEESFFNKSRLNQIQREYLKIDETKIGINIKAIPLENLVPGKLYYQGDNGKLESFLFLDSGENVHEILVSYDPKGDYVDCIEIGLVSTLENEGKKFATLSVNKLSVFELAFSKMGDKKEEIVTEYSINPQLRFRKGKTFTKLL